MSKIFKQNLLQYSFVSLYNKLILVLICSAVSFLHWLLQCNFMLWCLVSLRLMLDLTWLFFFSSSTNASNFISNSITFVLCKKLPVNFTERKKSYWCSSSLSRLPQLECCCCSNKEIWPRRCLDKTAAVFYMDKKLCKVTLFN